MIIDEIVDKYNKTYRTIKMKLDDIKVSTFFYQGVKHNKKDPKFKVSDHVRISKYKNIFAEGYTPNWSEKVFVITKVQNTVPWIYIISDLIDEEIVGTFYEKELQKASQKEFRNEEVIKTKGDKLYIKWKGHDN